MLNQRFVAIAVRRIGIPFAFALSIGASGPAGADDGSSSPDTIEAGSGDDEITYTATHCISAFRRSAASDDGCELEDATIDGDNTCTLEGVCRASDGDWTSFNFAVDLDDVADLQNCDGELRAECAE